MKNENPTSRNIRKNLKHKKSFSEVKKKFMAKDTNRKIMNVNKIFEPPKIKSTENICRKKRI